jgi:hypothetical protein
LGLLVQGIDDDVHAELQGFGTFIRRIVMDVGIVPTVRRIGLDGIEQAEPVA